MVSKGEDRLKVKKKGNVLIVRLWTFATSPFLLRQKRKKSDAAQAPDKQMSFK